MSQGLQGRTGVSYIQSTSTAPALGTRGAQRPCPDGRQRPLKGEPGEAVCSVFARAGSRSPAPVSGRVKGGQEKAL